MVLEVGPGMWATVGEVVLARVDADAIDTDRPPGTGLLEGPFFVRRGLVGVRWQFDIKDMSGVALDAASLRGIFNLRKATRDVSTSLERLSTGKKVKRASDDPSGLIASESLGAQIKGLESRIKSISQQDAYIGAREGGYSVVTDLLTELKGLVVTAGNRDTMSETEKRALQEEASGILNGITKISQTSTFKGQAILTEANTSALGRITTGDGKSVSLANIGEGGTLNFVDGDLETAQEVIDAAATTTSTVQATVGAQVKAN